MNPDSFRIVGVWDHGGTAVCHVCEIRVCQRYGFAYYNNIKSGEEEYAGLSDFVVCEDGRIICVLVCPKCGRDMRVE